MADAETTQHDETSSLMKVTSASASMENTTEGASSEFYDNQFVGGILDELLQSVHESVMEVSKLAPKSSVADDILDTILRGADYNIALKDEYTERCRAHNQYGLFNMKNLIANFNMDDATFNALCFRECLIVNRLDVMFNKDGDSVYVTTPVGGVCVDVQKAEGKQPHERLLEQYEQKLLELLDTEGIFNHIDSSSKLSPPPVASEDSLDKQLEYGYSKFLVHVSSHLDVEGSNGGSSITSWVDRNFHTIEELRKEFIVDETTDIKEKALYTAMKHHWYYIKHTSSVGYLEERKLYSMNKMRDYISESANFVLMRYLAKLRYFGMFELSCCYINGDMCRNIYDCCGPESDVFNDTRVDCCRIKRTIIEECGLVHRSITCLSLQGLILKHEWEGCNYVLTVNPILKIKSEKPSCLDEVSMGETWAQDMQLLSQYLDMKNQALLEAKTYDADHPELRQLLADYVNQIVLLRPPDIKNFTYGYFGNFVSSHLPHNDYLE